MTEERSKRGERRVRAGEATMSKSNKATTRMGVEVQIEQAVQRLTESVTLSKTQRWQAVQHLAAARKMLAEEGDA